MLIDFEVDLTLGCNRDEYGRVFRMPRVDAREDRKVRCPRCHGVAELHFHHGPDGKLDQVATDSDHFVLRRAPAFQLIP
ncbi:MAG: hypothetical protein HYY02_06435 [Chloroflexi bacterium]|nr:hypothetical protein [Chloroflexota bacterium]